MPTETTPLEDQVDLLIAWIEANTADHTDVREALSAAGIRLGQRADRARQDELAGIKSARKDDLARAGKVPLIAEAAEAVAALTPQDAQVK